MDELLEKYIEEFGEGFPMYQLGRSRKKGDVIKIIKECLEKKKDAYELGYVTDDEDVYY